MMLLLLATYIYIYVFMIMYITNLMCNCGTSVQEIMKIKLIILIPLENSCVHLWCAGGMYIYMYIFILVYVCIIIRDTVACKGFRGIGLCINKTQI